MSGMLLSGVLLAVPGLVVAESWTLEADAWARPRSGEVVADMAPVREAVQAWLAEEDARLIVRYPGGESGQLWASELRGWLVALGLEPDRVELYPGAATEGTLELAVE